MQVQTVGTTREQDGAEQDQDDAKLGQHQPHQHLGRQVDLTVAKDGDQCDGDIGPDVPRQIQPELGEGARGDSAEKAHQANLHGVIGQDGDHGRSPAHAPAQTLGGEGIESACVFHMTAHRDIADREGQQDQRHDQETARDACAVAEQHRRRNAPACAGQRSGSRHHHEGDGRNAEGVFLQLIGGGTGVSHAVPPG